MLGADANTLSVPLARLGPTARPPWTVPRPEAPRTFGFTYEEIGMGDGDYSLFTAPGGDRPAGGIGQTGADQTGGETFTLLTPPRD